MTSPAPADLVPFMQRALFWAERGRGRTSPNPMVGAVVVTPEGVVVGQGAHLAAGTAHAEVHALDEAGTGRPAPPCTARSSRAATSAVPVPASNASSRPASRASSRRFRIRIPSSPERALSTLLGHGIAVDVGPGAPEAARQNEAFFTWIRRRRPFVIAKAALSKDGFVGRARRRERLTGAEADRWFHRQRAEIDAIAVGAETVLTDDPLLTAREVFRLRPLTRVLFDWRLRLQPSARVFKTLDAGPVIMVVSEDAAGERPDVVAAWERRGVRIEAVGRRNLAEVLARLAERGLLSVLLEGGPTLQAAFFAAGLVDRVQRVETPHVLGTGVGAAAAVRDPAGPLVQDDCPGAG